MFNIKKGKLLISEPSLIDPTFFKSIVLITHHCYDESIGLVINHKTKIKLHEVITNIPTDDFPVYIGGPVEKNTIHFIHTLGEIIPNTQKIIEGLTRKVHEGEIFSGVVTRIIPIGAFVEILPGKEGMVHISQLSEARVERVEDVVRQGDEVTVRVREIDSRGRINLTLRGITQNGGMSYPEPTPTPVAPLN